MDLNYVIQRANKARDDAKTFASSISGALTPPYFAKAHGYSGMTIDPAGSTANSTNTPSIASAYFAKMFYYATTMTTINCGVSVNQTGTGSTLAVYTIAGGTATRAAAAISADAGFTSSGSNVSSFTVSLSGLTIGDPLYIAFLCPTTSVTVAPVIRATSTNNTMTNMGLAATDGLLFCSIAAQTSLASSYALSALSTKEGSPIIFGAK